MNVSTARHGSVRTSVAQQILDETRVIDLERCTRYDLAVMVGQLQEAVRMLLEQHHESSSACSDRCLDQ